jgi:hypothetical protein
VQSVRQSLDPRDLHATDIPGIYSTGRISYCSRGCCNKSTAARMSLMFYQVGDGRPACVVLFQVPLNLAIERFRLMRRSILLTAESLGKDVRWLTPAEYRGSDLFLELNVRDRTQPSLVTLLSRSSSLHPETQSECEPRSSS